MIRKATALVVAAALLAGCGVRGSLETPQAAGEAPDKTAQADSGQGKPAGNAPKPHKAFVLDGLLQ